MIRLLKEGIPSAILATCVFIFVCSPSSSQEGPEYVVANTAPPDAYLALRTRPAASGGQRIMRMPNGTRLQVLRREPSGWWLVHVLPGGPAGWALSRQGDRMWIVIREIEDVQDPAVATDRVCSGILTVNRIDATRGEDAKDDGARLIRAEKIGNSCLFQRDSVLGDQILRDCRMGHGCEVRARVNDDSSDVYVIKKVYSARGFD